MSPSVVLVLTAIVVAAGYGLACRVWPYAACRRCHGSGKSRSPSGKAWRPCRRCKGSGARLRIGRRIINRWSDTARKASQ